MFLFCHNYCTDQEFLYDSKTSGCYLLITKNASRAMTGLATVNPSRYSIQNIQFLKDNNIKTVGVFLREPYDRFISGLKWQMHWYEMSNVIVQRMIDINSVICVDAHTVPQFWYLLSTYGKVDLEFEFHDLADISKVIPEIQRENTSPISRDVTFPESFRDKFNFLYTEDIVLYNQFRNCKATLSDIIEKIKLEKNFTEEFLRYKKLLTYLE